MREMGSVTSRREKKNGGDDERRSVKIDENSKKTNDWKSLKEMKEYLRSKYEKKAELGEGERSNIFAFRCLSGRC